MAGVLVRVQAFPSSYFEANRSAASAYTAVIARPRHSTISWLHSDVINRTKAEAFTLECSREVGLLMMAA